MICSSEILPLRLRQRGSSISTAANWIFNYVRVSLDPIKGSTDRITDDRADHSYLD